jgi:cell wall-associated NlpC family hydrolase
MACLLALLVAGCATDRAGRTIRDLQTIPQHASVTSAGLSSAKPAEMPDRDSLSRDYLRHFFAPWQEDVGSTYAKGRFFGAAKDLATKKLFGENLQPWPAGRLPELVRQCDSSSFPNADFRAITIRDTNVRALPTNHPGFYSFALPGEGYPFDYIQYSALWAGTPIRVCQISRNKAWALVVAGFVHGWIPLNDLAVVDKSLRDRYQNGHFAVPLKDGVSLVDTGGVYRFMTHIGALYPLDNDGMLLLPVADATGRAVLVRAQMSSDSLAEFPLPRSRANQVSLAEGLLGQAYGWGGMYFNRDCSSMTRDYMGAFGIWLPRNSSKQAKQGRRIELAGLSPSQKEQVICEQGVPFATLIWMRGHVTLYIGQHRGRALILHNTWGLKTRTWSGKEGRQVIGKTVITTLQPGAELPDLDRPMGLLINKVTGMSVLPCAGRHVLKTQNE